MSLYALGDLHLSFQSDKSMDIFGSVWKRHERKIEKYVNRIVKPDDTLVLTGDHSWGRKLPECREDLAFIERLPGRKILLRGNHDMFWDAKKTERLNEEYKGRPFFLQNNFAVYEDYALVGTKGFTFEGPFYLDRWGNITGWDEKKEEQAEKLVEREMHPASGVFPARRLMRDTENSSCFSTIRRRIYWKRLRPLRRLRKSTVFQRLSIPTVTGRAASGTVSAENFTGSTICWYPGIT